MSLKTLTDLYAKGTEVVLKDGSVLWVQKLTPYEQGEVRQKASLARARTILAMKEIGSDEVALFDAQATELTDELLVDLLLQSRFAELYQEATAEVGIDEDWQERNEIRRTTDPSTLVPGSPEDALLTKLENEYIEEVMARVANRTASTRERLTTAGREANLVAYREQYVEAVGRQTFIDTYGAYDLVFMIRQCSATQLDGRFDHTTCDHSKKYLAGPEELRQLPEELVDILRAAESKIVMSVEDARFLDSPGNSSDSSAEPSAPAVSASSTPVGSSPPGGTSP